ncbi:MAG: glycosyltransferase family 2 protein, partial [Candidatus Dadabacteria bacterium]|nr:glycosyltransferase family 2 protein [Candidatus Dadabacteria bacterium]NIS09213.1 glycosyltransferase family 2 protein [Candidatus Dadabacteria bacterium]NIV43197.1 glycosyltransferase [Candidatus Dadabacteria bacterium]NIY22263.1 glycosyltransferase [Candidatus Dadabacteria bacterium]
MKKPLFSIIIPTYNRNDQLTECLHSISRLNYSTTNFEVIVVNDGGEVKLDQL